MLRFGKTEKDFQNAYRDYSGSIHRTLRGMTGNESIAEELTQEAFFKAWKGLPQFGFKSSLKTWIYQVAINVGRDWLRSHKGISLHSQAETEVSADTDEQNAIRESLLELDEDSRTILILFYWEGMKQDEMASVLNIPEGTVKSRLHSSRTKLKALLLMRGFEV